jgi:hypothetical protein
MNALKAISFALAAPLVLTACSTSLFRSTPTNLYYKDGQSVYLASCERASWKGCLEQAGLQCRSVGYHVLEKNPALGYNGENEIIFNCKGDPDAAAKG